MCIRVTDEIPVRLQSKRQGESVPKGNVKAGGTEQDCAEGEWLRQQVHGQPVAQPALLLVQLLCLSGFSLTYFCRWKRT